MWIHKIRNNFHISTFLNNFFTGKCKKILLYVIGQDFITKNLYHVTNLFLL